MPYIPQKDREQLDTLITALADKIVEMSKKEDYDAAFAGLLNYSSTTLAMQISQKRFKKMRYWLIATISGTFHNVADEFYRRVGVPYEDMKIRTDGDTAEYAAFQETISK